jgi:hypothetical protein
MARFRRRVRRTRSGAYVVSLPAEERALVRELLAELRALVVAPTDDPRVRRLYPTAYPDDPDKDAEFRRFMHEELVASRTAAIDTVEATLDAATLDAEQVNAWMQALNSLRLVLGTALDVSEDDDLGSLDPADPDARSHILYSYLGYLLEEIVQTVEP